MKSLPSPQSPDNASPTNEPKERAWTEEQWAWAEVRGAKLPDTRFKKSLAVVCQKLQQQPGVSFSRACGSKRKAVHRIMSTTQATPQDILQGHSQQTRLRSLEYPFILAASDTTSFDFTSRKSCEGLGTIGTKPKSQGFLTHSVLAISPSGVPLGIIYQKSWTRNKEDFGISNQREKRSEKEKESYKWTQALQGVESVFEQNEEVLLIQDREADIFSFLQEARREKTHLLIRSCHPRSVLVEGKKQNLWEISAASPIVARKSFSIKVKKGNDYSERIVNLTIRCRSVEILAPHRNKSCSSHPIVWVIFASEENAPVGENPIEWILISTYPVLDSATALDMVRFYTYRWLIERFHYVLKSGLGVERLQLDSADDLMKSLSFYSIVGWRLLYLLYLSRDEPDSPAIHFFEELTIEVLCAHSGRSISTVSDAIMSIARVGGFRPCPSAPRAGVKSLWLGLRRLEGLEQGWQLALSALARKDMGQD